QLRGRLTEIPLHIISTREERLLPPAILRRVPSIRRLNRTTTHARQTTPLRTSNHHHAIALSPNARLILRHKRHALTQTRSSPRSDNINTATIRQTDELLTRPNDPITQRTLINHRPQRAVSIIRLILSRRR